MIVVVSAEATANDVTPPNIDEVGVVDVAFVVDTAKVKFDYFYLLDSNNGSFDSPSFKGPSWNSNEIL